MPLKDPNKKYFADPSLGYVMGVGLFVFTLLGIFVDKKFNTSPWGLISGILLGIFYGAFEVWKTIQEIDDE